MKSSGLLAWQRDPFSYALAVASFAGSMYLAWSEDWRTTDLLWGLWLSSLVVGYVTLLAGMGCVWWRSRGLAISSWFAVGGWAAFTAHFLFLHWVGLQLLPFAFPQEFANTGASDPEFWHSLWSAYWPVVALTLVAEVDVVFNAARRYDKVSPYLNLFRIIMMTIPATFISLLGYFTGLFTIDHIACYTLASLFFFSPWRFGRALEPGVNGLP